MASGFGYNGGQSRCFAYWQEFAKCFASANVPSQCVLQASDYVECLHHLKEIERAKAIKDALAKKAGKNEGQLAAASAEVGVGLIPKGEPAV